MLSDTTGDMVITNTQIMEATEKGANDRALHIAENLLRECVPFEFIAKCTELPLAVVKALNQQLQRDYQFNTDFVPFSGVCVS